MTDYQKEFLKLIFRFTIFPSIVLGIGFFLLGSLAIFLLY